ncbi:hypothetical protein Kpol_431p7 [Vanderwaltozyma polyspora DSM 70294]|uniref:U3 small nucleolar RNA-associated protein 11 n=1 Tax=Vanderwaltozyma polyspora (strain ATCC 22028 / DSM 70294 / BCRC 21397 / CBS 2163 / NBRC 10782 / NRRL Y-8283 / UCD 57-17) TaxID=436907 RepID=A7TRM8_VANPO|nr:uncharacterized protein Kpol_431p7 [Vanderwaltozyma polyspora DSM 70294]EDO15080.1 hypothetical protein Kpol_431p7 [Vanderwaltozyma polyspora DSM 70294]
MAKLVHNVQKKQHRERSQLTSRARLGHLEKHKDYVKRAQDYHKKEKSLKILREKVKERNEDEYYHGMHSRKLDQKNNLLYVDRNNNEDLSNDQVKLLKSQDVNYIRTLRTAELNKIENYRKKNLIINSTSLNKESDNHKVFVDNKNELKNFKPEVYFNTSKELLHKRENRLTNDQLLETEFSSFDSTVNESLKRKKLKNLKIMQSHIKRESELKNIEQRMNLQREVMKNGSKKKITDPKTGKISFKWKKQRKR